MVIFSSSSILADRHWRGSLIECVYDVLYGWIVVDVRFGIILAKVKRHNVLRLETARTFGYLSLRKTVYIEIFLKFFL